VTVTYKPTPEVHSLHGAIAGFRHLSAFGPFRSLLDVGAGSGTWMSAAHLAGVPDVWGTDISKSTPDDNILRACTFEVHDASTPFDLHRTFDCVICLEVAEHLCEQSAKTLISSLGRHGNLVFFSAARPGQFGQDHINCQWPSYWQDLFNAEGFRCIDDVRWRMWSDPDIEPWYRQNMFRAVRDSMLAGSEPRIPSVVHPEMLSLRLESNRNSKKVENSTSQLHLFAKMMIGKLTGGLR
jgi:SAM-dependent methyltransferase